MPDARSELERALAEEGGPDAPRDTSARLRRLLDAELGRGARELGEKRTGYETPIAVAVAAGEEVVAARAAALAAAAVEHIVEGASPGPPASPDDFRLRLGQLDGMLALAYPAAD